MAENGVLERDVHFEVVIGGTTYRGVVAAGDTIDNEQENYAADEANRQGDPVAALAQDVAGGAQYTAIALSGRHGHGGCASTRRWDGTSST